MAKRARRRRSSSDQAKEPPPKLTFMDLHGRKVAYVVALAVIVTVLVVAFTVLDLGGDENGPKDAPPFILVSVDGDPVDLRMYRGRDVVLSMFTTWCNTCRDQMEELKKLRAEYPEEVIVILSVDIDEMEEEQIIRDYRDQIGADWPFALDTDNVKGKYGVGEPPALVMIDRDGKLVWEHDGVATFDQLKHKIKTLMGGQS